MRNTNVNTPYDDVFRTLLTDCSSLIIPVVNEIFHENYTGEETVTLKENELFLKQPDGGGEKRITDSSFVISGSGAGRHYHIECQSTPDGTMLIRMYEYDCQMALKEGEYREGMLEVNFPHSAVLYLRHTRNTPDELTIKVNTPGGSISYGVPAMKVQSYGIETIFEKKLLFLLPFYIFAYEKQLPELEADREKRKQLRERYAHITARLDGLCEKGELDEYTKKAICQMAEKVVESLAAKYEGGRKEVMDVMGGKVLDYEAKMILLRGREEGRLLLLEELVRSGSLTMEEAAAAVHVTVAELEDAFEELQ